MAKKMTNWFWATLMPVFSPQPKHKNSGPQNVPSPPKSLRPNTGHVEAHNGLIVYSKHKDGIDFSSSVLDAMQAVVPVIVPEGVLKSSVWDGPKLFQEFIFANMVPDLGRSSEEMYNDFVLLTGLYIEDPLISSPQPPSGVGKVVPIVPNPDFNLAEVMLESVFTWRGAGLDQDEIDAFIKITGEEFYELLLPDNYGFSTTLIFPNQDLLDGDEDADSMLTLEKAILEEAEKEAKEKDKEKRRKMSYEEWIKWMEKQRKPDPWGPPGPGDPWSPDPYPNVPQPKPNPYGYPPEDDWNPKKWNYQDYEQADLKKYAKILGKKEKDVTAEEKEWMKKLHNKWRDYERYKKFGGSSASSASQVHNK